MIQHNVLAGRGLWVFGALSSDSPNGLSVSFSRA